VSIEAPSSSDLTAFRDRADRFVADLDEEYYLHYAGLKEKFEVDAVYERYEDLSRLELAQSFAAAPTELHRFACESYLGHLTRDQAARVATIEAELESTSGGEKVPYRMLRVEIMNEEDRGRRQRLNEERLRLLDEHINPLHLDAARINRDAVRRLGASNYYELYKQFGFRLDELAAECRELLDETEQVWQEEADRAIRARTGIALADAQLPDLARMMRAPDLDELYPSDAMLPALETTLEELGIDLHAQRNVHLDLDQRPLKSPRAFCSPIEVPERVMLVIQPVGGKDDWEALFHEAGHTEHFAHTAATLPMEARRLGDMAVTEGWATVFEHLVTEPEWLKRRLNIPLHSGLPAEGALSMLFYTRRYSAKLLYEIEFFQADDPATMRDRYAELLGDALKLRVDPESYLDDIDGGFYVSGYLRSWAFEAQLREFLRSEFGDEWFARKAAGDLLRELWALGQGPTADELLRDVSGARLEMAAVGERIRERLRA
jgi:hypothetical protein